MHKKKILFVTHEFPPDCGGVGVSAERISGFLSTNYDLTLFHLLQAKGKQFKTKSVEYKSSPHRYVKCELIRLFDERESRASREKYNYQKDCLELESYRLLENEIFEGDYDLIISFYILHYGMQLTLLSKKYNIPIVQCIRGNDVGKSVFQGENFGKLQFILKSATAVTSVSDDLKKVAQVIAPKVRIESFLNSIDPSKCASQSQKENTFTIASAGKFKFKKGISFLLEAVAGLDFDYKLKLIGDFNKDYEKEIFYKQLEIFGLNESKVELTGNLKRSEVWDEIHSSHVFVQPSLFSEGCPNTLLEAICLKVPIIASDVGAIPQIITHEENGFLVGAGNFLAIKESIEKLYHRSSLGLEFSQEALRRLDINSQDIEKERWLSLIAELLS